MFKREDGSCFYVTKDNIVIDVANEPAYMEEFYSHLKSLTNREANELRKLFNLK